MFIIFIAIVTWYVIYTVRLANASLSVLVRDYNDLWIITNTNVPTSNKKYSMFNSNRISCCNSFIDDVKNNKKIFVEAATGIGKTIATVYPSIRALEEEIALLQNSEKIYENLLLSWEC